MFAEHSPVPVERTRAEIEKLIGQAGATAFLSATDGASATIGFHVHRRSVRFRMPLPQKTDPEFVYVDPERARKLIAKEGPNGNVRWERKLASGVAEKRLAQATRSRWRALLLTIKAKLSAVESGVETFEEAFLAHVVGEDGRTIGEVMIPTLATYDATRALPGGR